MKFISASVLNMADLNFKTGALDSQMHMLPCFVSLSDELWHLLLFKLVVFMYFVCCRWWYNKASYDCVKACLLSVASHRWLMYDEGNWQSYVHLLTLRCGCTHKRVLIIARGAQWIFINTCTTKSAETRAVNQQVWISRRGLSKCDMTFRFLTGVLFYTVDYYDFGDLVTLHGHATVPSGFDCSTRFCGEL